MHPFTKITVGPPVTQPGAWVGCAWGDYDGDGWMDLFVVQYGPDLAPNHALYRNQGDGTFAQIAEGPVATDVGRATAGVWGDYNNDGHLDLFVAHEGENNLLYRNRGDGTFEKIVTGSVVTDAGTSRAAAWGDFDRDGWLDLFVANGAGQPDFLYHNNRDGTFARIATGDAVTDEGDALACAWIDYDGDGWLDLLVSNLGGIFQYHNEGNGALKRIADGDLANVEPTPLGMDAADYDHDGDLDLFFANYATDRGDFLFRNEGNGVFTSVAEPAFASDTSNGNDGAWGDYDNDGDVDLFVANTWFNRQGNFLYENNGDGTFTRVTNGVIATEAVPEDGLASSQGSAWADYNNDGFLDLFVSNANQAGDANSFLYRNGGNGNSWIKIRCVGTKSNRSAFGAIVRVKAVLAGTARWQMREISGSSGYGSQNAPEAHFGLKDAATIETLRIEWPSGIVQELHNVPTKQTLTVTESAEPPSSGRPNFIGINRLVDGRARLVIQGESGKTYRLEASSNLADWLILQSVKITNADGSLELVDETPANLAARFYRLMVVP